MTIETPNFAASQMHFLRVLGDQVHIEGPRRLSHAVLLDFEEGLLSGAPPGGLLFAPPTSVQATMFVPGPCHSDLTLGTVAGMTELTAAICAFASGRPVTYGAPVFPVEEPEASNARARRADNSIPGLARESVSLDVYGCLFALGGLDAVLRARGSLLAYHAALKQDVPDVAVMLLVTCIEALLSPRGQWGKEKVTKRFIKSLLELCPDAVDKIVDHGNVGQAFDYKLRGGQSRRRQDLLDRIYQSRSLPTHAGLTFSSGGLTATGDMGSMRVALLSDLARAAVLAFIQAPRSSLIGYPKLQVLDGTPNESS